MKTASAPAFLMLAVVSLTNLTAARAQTLVGSEFQVNTYTTGYQYDPAVAGTAVGDFVVAWESYPQLGEGAGSDVFAQRFGADQAAIGTEFQVNTYTSRYQYYPHIGVGQDGAFVVVWMDDSRDGDGAGIFGQRFDSDGVASGTEFSVSGESAGYQSDPRVSVDTDGNFVVVWWTEVSEAAPDPDGSGSGIFARRFAPSATPLGTDFRINEQTIGSQGYVDVDHDADGNFVVVWHGAQLESTDISVRRFAGDGTPIGTEVSIAHELTDSYPRVSVASNGGFVVVWQNSGPVDGVDGDALGIFAQRFNADGTTAGSVFQVNTYTTSGQADAVVAMSGAGPFMVTWDSYMQLSTSSDVIAQRYTTDGTPLGDEFKVDTFDDGGQVRPQIAWIGEDRFVVIWQSFGQDGDSQGIFGQVVAAEMVQVLCGDADSSGTISATDALTALRTAVGTSICEACVCDVNGAGGTTASDALAILRVAVGQPLELDCPACA